MNKKNTLDGNLNKRKKLFQQFYGQKDEMCWKNNYKGLGIFHYIPLHAILKKREERLYDVRDSAGNICYGRPLAASPR
jgi:hypothetical protein